MFAFMSGVVNNDAGVSAAAALALYLVVRALRRGLTVRLAVALGVTVVVLPLMKGNGLFLLPAIALGVAGAALRGRRAGIRPRRPLAALCAAVAATAVVAVGLSSALDHSADPTRAGWHTAVGNTYPTVPGKAVQPSKAFGQPLQFAEYVWQLFLPPAPGMTDVRPGGERIPAFHAYVKRGWGAFGFISIQFPKWVYAVIALTMLALLALAVLAWRRHRAAASRRGWELTVLVLVILGVFLGTEVTYFAPGDPTLPEHGRYLFPAAGALAALAVLATFGLGRRRAVAIASGLLTAMLALFWAAQFLTMSALYT
jgi:4-amino-4-deoxy-L-arabinose transferase-like glycosyltransferase